MKTKRILGVAFVILSIIVTVNLFILSKESFRFFLDKPLLSLSQFTSLLGTIFLCLSFVLSSRFSFLEDWFGGLDKVYKTHRIFGGISFVFLLSHPMLLIANYLPNKSLAASFVLPGQNWSYNFGIFALWIMIVFLFFTIYVKLPYNIWKKLHEYMGLVLLFGALHVFLIKSDISRFFLLRLWIMSFLFLAFYSYVYIRFLYSRIGPKFHYVVDDFNRAGDILEINLKPITKSLNFKPGQFVFLQFENHGDLEMHPFSISSDPFNSSVRFSIKIVGDFTLSLRELKRGTVVRLWGPYGKFSERFFQDKSAVCIAGGIGVTPFLGMLSLEAKMQNREREVFLFYCGKNLEELCYHNEIASLSQVCSTIRFISHCSTDRGRINANHVLDIVGDFKNKLIFLCGPILMMKSLKEQFVNLGVKEKDIIFEDFNFK